ncbi:MAG: hypothetical protein Q4A92_02855 [Corynebacterium sp.]|nr:hypothetical protein [Corynebacterium sp.]
MCNVTGFPQLPLVPILHIQHQIIAFRRRTPATMLLYDGMHAVAAAI